MPAGDVGLAIVFLTILVKVILFPLGVKASHTQIVLRTLEPQLRALREKYTNTPQELAMQTLALYRQYKVNPFASFFIILLQLPVIFGLYWVIWADSKTGVFDTALLYPFVVEPQVSSFVFLNIVPLNEPSVVLAVLVAGTQYALSRLMLPTAPLKTGKAFQDDLMASMHIQMRYVFPLLLGGIAYVASAAIALYFLTSNIFGILQEVAAKRRHAETHGNQAH